MEKISIADIEQKVFVRLAIEKESVLMFPKLTIDAQTFHLTQLAENLTQQRYVLAHTYSDSDFKSSFIKLDDAFHEKLCAISQGSVAWATIKSLQGQIDRIRYLNFENITSHEEVTQEHEHIYNCLKELRIDECISVLTTHLEHIKHTYKEIAKNNAEWFTQD